MPEHNRTVIETAADTDFAFRNLSCMNYSNKGVLFNKFYTLPQFQIIGGKSHRRRQHFFLSYLTVFIL